MILQQNNGCDLTKSEYLMKGEGKYTESFGVSTQIKEIYRKFRGIYPNQEDIQKVSGYPPKPGSYTESFRIISSYASKVTLCLIMESEPVIQIPKLPKFDSGSPELVAILDKIRFEIDKKDEEGKLFEFYWFAREYPRFYRYHLDHAEYRLNQIHEKYQNLSKEIVKIHYQNSDSDIFQVSVGGLEAHVIYWDFESYLSSISCALDVLARVVGTAYSGSPPVSFNKLCAKKEFTGIVDILRKAQWEHPTFAKT